MVQCVKSLSLLICWMNQNNSPITKTDADPTMKVHCLYIGSMRNPASLLYVLVNAVL